MANFDPPFSNISEKRFPTSDERRNGFDCGAADRELFNGLFHRIEAEIGEVITHAGIVPSDTDFSQLRQAIVALIEAASGEGDNDQYLLLSQARARLPIFPEIQTTDGKITVIQSAPGNIRLPGGVFFQHRGIYPEVTAQTDFPTTASRTYHLRWTPSAGVVLYSLSDVDYNPLNLPETDPRFDSSYDNMLIARVITNSANVATITNLVNRNVMQQAYFQEYTFNSVRGNSQSNPITAAAIAIDWARTPLISIGQMGTSSLRTAFVSGGLDLGITGTANDARSSETTRYNTRTALQVFNPTGATISITAHYQLIARA